MEINLVFNDNKPACYIKGKPIYWDTPVSKKEFEEIIKLNDNDEIEIKQVTPLHELGIYL